jgi:hypothetical protein
VGLAEPGLAGDLAEGQRLVQIFVNVFAGFGDRGRLAAFFDDRE